MSAKIRIVKLTIWRSLVVPAALALVGAMLAPLVAAPSVAVAAPLTKALISAGLGQSCAIEHGKAVGVGCATHVVGDMLTAEGCPLFYPFRLHFRLLPGPLAFTTGTGPEVWVVGPVLAAGLCLLFYQAFQLGVISVKLS